MVAFRLVGYLAGAVFAATACALPQPEANSPRSPSIACRAAPADPQITNFVNELAVPASQASAVTTLLGSDSNLAAYLQKKPYVSSKLTQTACAALKLVLGGTKVQSPVTAAVADENW